MQTCISAKVWKTISESCYLLLLLTWSRVKGNYKHSHNLIFFCPLISRWQAAVVRNVTVYPHSLRPSPALSTEVCPGTGRASDSAANISCYIPARTAGAAGDGSGTNHSVRGQRWWRSRLVRIWRWDLLPVQQWCSIRLLHHGAAACEDTGRGTNNTQGSVSG